MKIKQIKNPDLAYRSIIEPLKRTDIIEDITDKFKFYDKQYAHVIYIHGTGGIGKTYVCRTLNKHIAEFYKNINEPLKVYSIYYDLFKNSAYPVKLMELASLIKEVLTEPKLFEVFETIFQVYIKRSQEYWNEQYSSDLLNNSLFDMTMNIGACIPGVSTITGFTQAWISILQYTTSKKKSKRLQNIYSKFEHTPLDDLRQQLCIYFVNDLNNYFKSHTNKRIVIILDTFESLIYKNNLQYNDYEPTDWLFGDDGIIRLLTNTTWVIAGRDKIDWKIYDKENSIDSFKDIEIIEPKETKVVEFLMNTGMGEEYAKRIADETNCFPLKFGMYLNLYMTHLRRKQENSGIQLDEKACILNEKEFKEISDIVNGSFLISDRFLNYFKLNEKEIIYTLACLKSWNDEILSDIIWKNSFGNFVFYETLKSFSFIRKEGTVYEIETTSLSALVDSCPGNLKNKLINCIINAIRNNNYSEQNLFLLKSLIHISLHVQTKAEITESIMQCLYKVIHLLFESYDIRAIVNICKDTFYIFNRCKEQNINFQLLLSSIIIIYKCCSWVNNINSYKKPEIMKFLINFERRCSSFIKKDLEYGFYYTLVLAYEFYNKFGVYESEIYKLTSIILKQYRDLQNQIVDESIFNYKTYYIAIAIEAKFYIHLYYKHKNDDTISYMDMEDEYYNFNRLYIIIDLLKQNYIDKENLLTDLIFFYIQTIIKHSVTLDKNSFRHDLYIDEYLEVYSNVIKNDDVIEQIKITYLKCIVAFTENNLKETVELVFSFIDEHINEFKTNSLLLPSFNGLFEYVEKSINNIVMEQDFINEIAVKKESYKKLLHIIINTFLKSYNFRYLDVLIHLNKITEYLFPDIDFSWYKLILFVNRTINESFMKNFILLQLQYYCKFIYNDATTINFNHFIDTPHIIAKSPNKVLTSCEVQIVLNYMYTNNCICKEISQNLIKKYYSSVGKDKNHTALLILHFYKQIINVKNISDISTKEAALYYNILQLINIKNTQYLTEQLAKRYCDSFSNSSRTCFDNFCGWIFYQNLKDDKKFLQDSFDIMCEFLLNDIVLIIYDKQGQKSEIKATLYSYLYDIIDFIFEKFISLREYISLGYNLLKFIKYTTDYNGVTHHVKPAFLQEKVIYWISKMLDSKFSIKFNKDLELVKELQNYGLFSYSENIEFSNKFNIIRKNKQLPIISFRKLYDIIFFQSEDEINLFLKEISNIHKKDQEFEFTMVNLQTCLREFILPNGYKISRTREEFIFLVDKIISYLVEIPIYFKRLDRDTIIDTLKFFMSIEAYKQVKNFVSILLENYPNRNSIYCILLKNFSIIGDIYEVQELFSDSLIKKLIGNKSYSYIIVYNELKNHLPEKHLKKIILESSAYILDKIFIIHSNKDFQGGLDGIHYHRLREIFGDDLDQELEQEIPYFAEARKFYLKNYKIYN